MCLAALLKQLTKLNRIKTILSRGDADNTILLPHEAVTIRPQYFVTHIKQRRDKGHATGWLKGFMH